MKAVKCPSDELSVTNKAIVSSGDFPDEVRWVFAPNYSQFFRWNFNSIFFALLPTLGILKCQQVQGSILCLQFIDLQRYPKTPWDSRCCKESGRHCRSIRISMWSRIVSIHPVQPNACAMSPWKWISCRRKCANEKWLIPLDTRSFRFVFFFQDNTRAVRHRFDGERFSHAVFRLSTDCRPANCIPISR